MIVDCSVFTIAQLLSLLQRKHKVRAGQKSKHQQKNRSKLVLEKDNHNLYILQWRLQIVELASKISCFMLQLNKFEIQKMKVLLIPILIAIASGQSGVPLSLLNNVSLNMFPAGTLSLYQDTNSLYYPFDFYLNIELANANIYTLGSNRIIQVYSKANLNAFIQTVTNYSFASGSPFRPVYVAVNQQENLLSLASFSSNILKYLMFAVDQNGFQAFMSICGDRSFSAAPTKVFMRGTVVYAYFKMPSGNDSIYITDSATNVSQVISFPFVSCSIVVSPSRQTALVWDSSSKIYIFNVDLNFTLKYTYTGSIAFSQYTQTIGFSSDSQFAIIETDNLNPIKVLNINDFTVLASIPGSASIRQCIFLDPLNRFLLIDAAAGMQVYDIQGGNLQSISGSFPNLLLQGDSKAGLLYNSGSNVVNCYGVNITDLATTVSSYPQTVTNSLNPSNTTNDNAVNPDQIDPSGFYILVNYTDSQHSTLSWITNILTPLNEIVEKIFAILFSSPFTAYFLSLFNYFTLSSYYVLVNIKVPQVVFYYLSRFYYSCTGNIISQFDLLPSIAPVSSEQVTQARPLYFEVSSDLVSSNYISVMVLVANVVLYEVLILATRKGPKLLSRANKTLIKIRGQTYWGLVVSNVVPIILPWKYMIFGGFGSPPNKLNLACEYIFLGVLFFLLVACFLNELSNAKRKRHPLKTALRDWWDSYENYIYPMFLLVDNPIYFMIGIGLSNLFSFYNSFYARQYIFFSVLKALYPVLFHCCFIVFMISENNLLLIMITFFCLSVFLIGSIHYLLETVVVIIFFTYSFIKNNCKSSNKINDCNAGLNAKEEPQHRRSKLRHDKVWRGQPYHSPKQLNIKEVMTKINEEINNTPNIKIMNIKRYQDGQKKQNQRIRVSKDRRQGSELMFLESKHK